MPPSLVLPSGKVQSGLPRDHISVSQIRMYLRCPAQYYFHYVKGLKTQPRGSQVLGKAVHSGLEYYFWHKMFIGQEAPLGDVLDVFNDAFEKERPDAIWEEEHGKAKDEGANLIKLYLQEMSQVIPLAVEKEIQIPIAGTNLLGYIDLIAMDGKIIDHKVVGKSPSEGRVAEDIQLTAYALGYRELYGELPREVQLNYMVRNKTPKLVFRTATRGERDIKRFLQVADGVVSAIRAGVFYPNPDCYLCNSSCGFWGECHNIRNN